MRKQKAGASWTSSIHVIKKLIRKLFGQESPAPSDEASKASALAADEAKPARKSTRKKAAVADKRDPNVPVILSSDIHGIDPSLISKNAIRVTDGLQEAGHQRPRSVHWWTYPPTHRPRRLRRA
jgi:poly(A) polymerase